MAQKSPPLDPDSVYHFIRVFLMDNNYPPGLETIRKEFECKSIQKVRTAVNILRDRGQITVVPYRGMWPT